MGAILAARDGWVLERCTVQVSGQQVRFMLRDLAVTPDLAREIMSSRPQDGWTIQRPDDDAVRLTLLLTWTEVEAIWKDGTDPLRALLPALRVRVLTREELAAFTPLC